MKRKIFFVLFIVVVQTSFAQNNWQNYIDSVSKLWTDPDLFFPQGKYEKVIAYTYNRGTEEQDGELGEDEIYNHKTKQFAKSIDSVTYTLTKEHVEKLLNIINDTSSFEWGESGCFVPHHAFVFYDKKGVPVASINVCFMCHQIYSFPQSPIMRWGLLTDAGYMRLEELCSSIGMWLPQKVD